MVANSTPLLIYYAFPLVTDNFPNDDKSSRSNMHMMENKTGIKVLKHGKDNIVNNSYSLDPIFLLEEKIDNNTVFYYQLHILLRIDCSIGAVAVIVTGVYNSSVGPVHRVKITESKPDSAQWYFLRYQVRSTKYYEHQ